MIHAADTSSDDLPTTEEMDGINSVIKETELMKALKEHADSHDKQLVAVNEMVVEELRGLHNHFEGIVAQMEEKEQLLLKHIDAVEKRLEEKLKESRDIASRGGGAHLESGTHFWPYTFLLFAVVGAAAFCLQKIKALKTEDDFYGGTRGRKRSQ